MVISIVEEAEPDLYHFDVITPEVIAQAAHLELGSRADIEVELDAMCIVLCQLHLKDPDEAMRILSGFDARCSHLSIQLVRAEPRFREYKQLRTLQVKVVLESIKQQYFIARGLLEARGQDLMHLGGQT